MWRPADEQTQIQRYADELTRLISQPAARATMGRQARARVEAHFSLDAMGDRIVSLIAKAGQFKQAAPRVAVSHALARESATQALELARLTAQAGKLQGELAAERARLARIKAIGELVRRQWWWRAARRCARLLGVGCP